jgi:CRISPR/Cas system-associated exonuclease Cas4 (RecB family)
MDVDFSRIYSFSKLKLFDQCPKSYHFFYIDEIYSKMKAELRRDPANIWSFNTLGKAVHDAITLYLHLPDKQKNQVNLKDQLKQAWRSEAMKQKLPPLGKWGGFQSLQEERKYYHQALLMLVNFQKLYDHNLKIRFLPTKNTQRSIEDYKKLIQPISKDYDISGKLDLAVDLNDHLGVIDFKTSKKQEKDIFQLKFYKLLAELNFQKPVLKASFYYLTRSQIKEYNLSNENTSQIKKLILNKINKIKKEKFFKPQPSKLCRYCIFKTFCPAKKQVELIIKTPIEDNSIEDLPF